MSAAERRIARDGAEYSKNDFLAWYGDIAGHQYWCGVGFRSARCFSACGRFESFDSFDLKL